MKKSLCVMLLCLLPAAGWGQPKKPWRAATPAELEAVMPDRAQVEKERIETEMRSATGITANGKYSHYLVVQNPIKVGDLYLRAGNYVIGWTRGEDGLTVHFYVAETGGEKGTVTARLPEKPIPVSPLRIWPPGDHGVIQIGRFTMPYTLED
jgi:hypothetical protein